MYGDVPVGFVLFCGFVFRWNATGFGGSLDGHWAAGSVGIVPHVPPDLLWVASP